MLHFPFILGSGCLLDYFDMNLIVSWGPSSLLSCCVVHFQESLCWQLVVSALVTAFMARNFLPERSDLYSPKCLWSFGLPLIAETGGGIWEVTRLAWPNSRARGPNGSLPGPLGLHPPHAASTPPLLIGSGWLAAIPSSKSAVDELCSQSSYCRSGCLHTAYRDTGSRFNCLLCHRSKECFSPPAAQQSFWLPMQVGERKVKYPLQTACSPSEQWVLFNFQAREPGSEEFVLLCSRSCEYGFWYLPVWLPLMASSWVERRELEQSWQENGYKEVQKERKCIWANTLGGGRTNKRSHVHYGSCLVSEVSLWLKATLCFWWDRSCTNSPKRRLISVLLLGRKTSPQLAAVGRMREIPGLPHHTALLKLPQGSHLQKPRS